MPRPYKTYDSEREAVEFMHDQAKRLKDMGVAWRYGVYCEPITKDRHGYFKHNGPWGVFIVDRKTSA
jgi:hypothetical protein